MKAADIVRQVMATLPMYSDAVSTAAVVESMTFAAGLVTVVTEAPHGLTTGAQVYVTGAESPVKITSLTQSGGIASGVTASPHDLTENWDQVVSVTGATQAGYNLTTNMQNMTVPNRLNFSYPVDKTLPTPATSIGDMLLFDGKDRGFNGQFQITVTNPTTFTYPIDETPYHTAFGTPVIHTAIRVSSAITIEQFLKNYSAQTAGSVWMVVTLGEVTASASRYVDVDAVDVKTMLQDYRQSLVEKFNLYVLIPCPTELAATAARDQIEDLKQPIFKSLIGVLFPSYLSEPQQYGVVLDSQGFYGYTQAYYVHEFTFQTLAKLTLPDTVAPSLNVAFRDINLLLQNPLNTDIMITDVNLDDEPAP